MDIKPIPAFYGVYLLRSTVRKASTYIGSTPNPSRRLGQHNGRVVGGAVRTSRASLRPWEMACIVAGFPSNIAALQFEWAWQNAHLTRHISPEQRISFATTSVRTKTNTRTGKTTTRKRPGRPTSSLMDRLSNLHLLLRVPYFSKWPLQLHFFSQDVYASWTAWCERVDEQIRPGISVQLDLPKPDPPVDDITSARPSSQKRKADLVNKGGVYGIDPTYARYQDVLTKSVFILDDGDGQKCDLCKEAVHLQDHLFTICPNDRCQSISHLTCLSKHFLQHANADQLVPEQGQCPSCHSSLDWVDLMTQLTLRNRGQKEVRKVLGKKRRPKAATAEVLESDSDDDVDQEREQSLELDALVGQHVDPTAESDSDADSVASLDSILSSKSTRSQIARASSQPTRPLEIVIEDSDDQG
ncbi:hypothetical protein DV735_g4204, partial [Chaetothyriales sp. CBS 134920]